MTVTVTKENFEEEVLKSEIPVLCDLWAAWCGPCRMLSPVLEEIDQERNGALKIAKINVDEQPELASVFGADAIPMMVLFRDGKPAKATVGYQEKEAVEEFLK